MKKIFQIASYDFKRLMLNPISMIVMIVVLIACLIFSAAYKIPTAEEYSASTLGASTREVFSNFNSTNAEIDTKTSLEANLDEARNYLLVQTSQDAESEDLTDYETLEAIVDKFETIQDELRKYADSPENSTYIVNQNISQITQATEDLTNFLTYYENLDVFESSLFITQSAFETFETFALFYQQTTNSNGSIEEILDELVANIGLIDNLSSALSEATSWHVDAEKLEEFQTTYIDRADEKLAQISEEMNRLNNSVATGEAKHVSDMASLVTNYKLTCESAKFGVQYELYLLLNNHFDVGNLYGYEEMYDEELKVALAKINFFFDDDSAYYTEHQVPLNFNTASTQVSAYDSTYTVVAIIGFFTILFGIFCAYKLFGLDRRNGKMDVILSQNVTFGQVFAGKTTAIFFTTSFIMAFFCLCTLLWSMLFHPLLANQILAVFNLSSAYTIHPFLFLLIKLIGIELQVMFYAIITIFLMNLSRKFEICFAIGIGIFVLATICNIFLNSAFVYCLFPFIHADVTSMLGGGIINAGFLQTALYSSGNFFISLAYYVVVVVLLYNFTNQLFKKN